MLKKTLALAFICATAFFLTGCKDAPGESAAMADAKVAADADNFAPSAFEVADLVRENGWKDGENYKVRFNYNLVTKYDYPGVIAHILEVMADWHKGLSDADKASYSMTAGLNSMLARMTSEAVNTGETVKAYRQMPVVAASIEKNTYFNEDRTALAVSAFETATSLKNYAVPIDAALGTKIPRQVTFIYIKTEKGWLKSN